MSVDDAVGRGRVVEGRVREVVVGQDDLARRPRPGRTCRSRPAAGSSGPSRGCACSGSRRRGRSGGARSSGPRGRPSPRPPRGAARSRRRPRSSWSWISPCPPSGSWLRWPLAEVAARLGGDGVRRGIGGRGGVVARALVWCGHDPRIRRARERTGMAVRRWRLRHPADARPDAGGRPGRPSVGHDFMSSAHRPRGAAAVTMPPTAGNPAGPTTTSRSYARCSLPAPRFAPPTWPSARSSWRWPWARPTSTRRWVACCSP